MMEKVVEDDFVLTLTHGVGVAVLETDFFAGMKEGSELRRVVWTVSFTGEDVYVAPKGWTDAERAEPVRVVEFEDVVIRMVR